MSGLKINDETLEIWNELPNNVKNDPSLAEFRMEYERVHGRADECHENNALLTSTNSKCPVQNVTKSKRLSSTRLSIVIVLFGLWLAPTIFLLTAKEKLIEYQLVAIESDTSNVFNVSELRNENRIGLILKGPFIDLKVAHVPNNSYILVSVLNSIANNDWKIPVDLGTKMSLRTQIFDINNKTAMIQLNITSNYTKALALEIGYDPSPIDIKHGTICAGFILVFLNILIISEVVHRSFAALLAAFFSMGTLAALNDRPTMNDVVNWIDSETLLLIFSMMLLVAILMDTGIFDYVAVCTFRISQGQIWPLISTLCIFSVIISAFLDNVTTILLMTPIVVRLCECLNLNPVPIFPIIVLHTNIAGLSTLIGHPPNLLITANPFVVTQGITFLTYSMHMVIGVLLALIQTHIQIRWQYGNIAKKLTKLTTNDLKASDELMMWEKSCASLPPYRSNDQQLLHKLMRENVQKINFILKSSEMSASIIDPEQFQQTLKRLRIEYPIKDQTLLVKSAIVFGLVISLFFIESVPYLQRLSLGWCALTGVLLLLIISNQNLDSLMQRIEWTTLIFFSSMFITMECLARLGLIQWIGKQAETIILCVDKDARLAVAIVIVLWISAFTSSVVDSVPVTAMMIKVVVALAENVNLSLPIQPLVWALAFGPTIGGNGTLYGASANIVCAGVAEKLGHKITFFQYFKVAFPVMIGNVLLITTYLLIAHVFFAWH